MASHACALTVAMVPARSPHKGTLMPFTPKATAVTAAAAAVLILGIDATTYAATGDSLLLGQINQASRATVIERTQPGPALRLTTRSGADAPFSTNATGRVTRLNADRVDGKDASALATCALSFRAGRHGQMVSPAGMWSTPVRPRALRDLVQRHAVGSNCDGSGQLHLRGPGTSGRSGLRTRRSMSPLPLPTWAAPPVDLRRQSPAPPRSGCARARPRAPSASPRPAPSSSSNH